MRGEVVLLCLCLLVAVDAATKTHHERHALHAHKHAKHSSQAKEADADGDKAVNLVHHQRSGHKKSLSPRAHEEDFTTGGGGDESRSTPGTKPTKDKHNAPKPKSTQATPNEDISPDEDVTPDKHNAPKPKSTQATPNEDISPDEDAGSHEQPIPVGDGPGTHMSGDADGTGRPTGSAIIDAFFKIDAGEQQSAGGTELAAHNTCDKVFIDSIDERIEPNSRKAAVKFIEESLEYKATHDYLGNEVPAHSPESMYTVYRECILKPSKKDLSDDACLAECALKEGEDVKQFHRSDQRAWFTCTKDRKMFKGGMFLSTVVLSQLDPNAEEEGGTNNRLRGVLTAFILPKLRTGGFRWQTLVELRLSEASEHGADPNGAKGDKEPSLNYAIETRDPESPINRMKLLCEACMKSALNKVMEDDLDSAEKLQDVTEELDRWSSALHCVAARTFPDCLPMNVYKIYEHNILGSEGNKGLTSQELEEMVGVEAEMTDGKAAAMMEEHSEPKTLPCGGDPQENHGFVASLNAFFKNVLSAEAEKYSEAGEVVAVEEESTSKRILQRVGHLGPITYGIVNGFDKARAGDLDELFSDVDGMVAVEEAVEQGGEKWNVRKAFRCIIGMFAVVFDELWKENSIQALNEGMGLAYDSHGHVAVNLADDAANHALQQFMDHVLHLSYHTALSGVHAFELAGLHPVAGLLGGTIGWTLALLQKYFKGEFLETNADGSRKTFSEQFLTKKNAGQMAYAWGKGFLCGFSVVLHAIIGGSSALLAGFSVYYRTPCADPSLPGEQIRPVSPDLYKTAAKKYTIISLEEEFILEEAPLDIVDCTCPSWTECVAKSKGSALEAALWTQCVFNCASWEYEESKKLGLFSLVSLKFAFFYEQGKAFMEYVRKRAKDQGVAVAGKLEDVLSSCTQYIDGATQPAYGVTIDPTVPMDPQELGPEALPNISNPKDVGEVADTGSCNRFESIPGTAQEKCQKCVVGFGVKGCGAGHRCHWFKDERECGRTHMWRRRQNIVYSGYPEKC